MDQKKVMIVEDEVIVGLDLTKKLEHLGYCVVPNVVRYGEEVLQAAEKEKPDLIIMDVRLKGEQDGTEAARIIREKLGLPIIFLTAYSDQTTLSKAKKTEPYAYLKKPIRTEDLKISLEMALYKAGIEKSLRESEFKLEKKVAELQEALDNIRTLKGLIPICANCKKIRDDAGYWNTLEAYIQKHSDAKFSHGMCPSCMDEFYGNENWYKGMKDNKGIDTGENKD